jgi:hypothetical protein
VRFLDSPLPIAVGAITAALMACATIDTHSTTSNSTPAPRAEHPNASPFPQTDPPSSQGSTFVGVSVCAACHETEHLVWSTSGHATARSSLEESRRSYSPECLSCHTTGLYRESGFSPATPQPNLENVGCESCHGAGSVHIGNPTGQKYGGLPLSGDACVACHNTDFSPDFEWEPYWLEIAH